MGGMGTGAGSSLLEGSDTDSSVSRLILSNNLLYNLCSFTQELVYSEKNSSLKIVYIEWKMIFPYKAIAIILMSNEYHQFRI